RRPSMCPLLSKFISNNFCLGMSTECCRSMWKDVDVFEGQARHNHERQSVCKIGELLLIFACLRTIDLPYVGIPRMYGMGKHLMGIQFVEGGDSFLKVQPTSRIPTNLCHWIVS